MNNEVIFKMGQENNLPEIEDGSLLFTTDTRKIFLDAEGNRIKMSGSDFIWSITTQAETSSISSSRFENIEDQFGIKMNFNLKCAGDALNTLIITINDMQFQLGEPTRSNSNFYGYFSILATGKNEWLIEYNLNNQVQGVYTCKRSADTQYVGYIGFASTDGRNFQANSTIMIEEIHIN